MPTDIPIVGDVKTVLEMLNPLVPYAAKADAWRDQISKWKAEYPFRYVDSDTVLKPQWVIEMLNDTTKGEAIVTTDVGQHQMWAAQYYKFNQPRSWITPAVSARWASDSRPRLVPRWRIRIAWSFRSTGMAACRCVRKNLPSVPSTTFR